MAKKMKLAATSSVTKPVSTIGDVEELRQLLIAKEEELQKSRQSPPVDFNAAATAFCYAFGKLK